MPHLCCCHFCPYICCCHSCPTSAAATDVPTSVAATNAACAHAPLSHTRCCEETCKQYLPPICPVNCSAFENCSLSEISFSYLGCHIMRCIVVLLSAGQQWGRKDMGSNRGSNGGGDRGGGSSSSSSSNNNNNNNNNNNKCKLHSTCHSNKFDRENKR